MSAAHHAAFKADGGTYGECSLHGVLVRNVASEIPFPRQLCVKGKSQLLILRRHEVNHQGHRDGVGEEGAVGCTCCAHVKNKDEKVIEYYIQYTHQGIQETGYLDVAAAP